MNAAKANAICLVAEFRNIRSLVASDMTLRPLLISRFWSKEQKQCTSGSRHDPEIPWPDDSQITGDGVAQAIAALNPHPLVGPIEAEFVSFNGF